MASAKAVVVILASHACRMPSRTKKVVKLVVGRPRQANSVKGLNKYTATTEAGFHDLSDRGDRYSEDMAAAPELAMSYRQSAEMTSRAV